MDANVAIEPFSKRHPRGQSPRLDDDRRADRSHRLPGIAPAGPRVKEVRISDAERFVICYNPEQAERDAAIRARLLAQLQETIAGTDKLSQTKRAELCGVISTKPGLARYLRVTPSELLCIDKQAIKAEAGLDGKYLLRCSDPHLSAEGIALCYKRLLQVERGWRDLKQVIDLRPGAAPLGVMAPGCGPSAR